MTGIAVPDRLSQWHEGRGALRMVLAAFIAFTLGHLIDLPGPYTAALTTIIVARLDTGGTLRASLQRMAATLLGAGLACLAAMARVFAVPEGLLLLTTLIPLALLVAYHPSFRAGMIAAIIVLSVPAQSGSAIETALLRAAEVGFGVIIGTLVSIAVLPSRTGQVIRRDAVAALHKLARLAADILQEAPLPETDRKALELAIRRDLRGLIEIAGRARPNEAAIAKLIANLNADLAFLRRDLEQRRVAAAGIEAVRGLAAEVRAAMAVSAQMLRRGPDRIAAPDLAALRAALAQALPVLRTEQAEGLIYLLTVLVKDTVRLAAVASQRA